MKMKDNVDAADDDAGARPGDEDERTMEPGSPGTWELGRVGSKGVC